MGLDELFFCSSSSSATSSSSSDMIFFPLPFLVVVFVEFFVELFIELFVEFVIGCFFPFLADFALVSASSSSAHQFVLHAKRKTLDTQSVVYAVRNRFSGNLAHEMCI
ncbi:MAG: hypothetical protein Homavirus10_1 [Homavirus sp.]|uniref:Uncharacterized protein n=1 Tax=Homavirus sp. TaxID=2487769 RepID=A0A3G5A527_9VIRU|nr:MAG: hypothetical protein Homavirus10_1 [Homavirus sp.]